MMKQLTSPIPAPTPVDIGQLTALIDENNALREEIRVSREAAEITANLVVKQFEETEKILRRFQTANAQRKAVLDSATQMAIIATNIAGVVIVFNSGAENLLGFRESEIVGKRTLELFHSPAELITRGRELSRNSDVKIEGVDFFLEYAIQRHGKEREWTYIHKNGTQFPVNMSITALRGPDGAVSGCLCIAMDITQKKQSEKALRESERNYRLLINNIPNIVFTGYPDGSIEFYDDKIEALTGYSRHTFNSGKMKWFDLVVDEDLDLAEKNFIEDLKTDKHSIREYRIRKKNGDIVWIEVGSQTIYDEKGDIEFITGAFLNISVRKRAEKALHESEETYRSLFNSGPNPIFVLDKQTQEILDANPSAEETYKYTQDELIGRCFADLGAFDYEDTALSIDEEYGWARGCVVSQKVRHFKKGNKPFYTKIKACPALYKGRETIILAATDITETIEKDAQLFQASKMTTLGEMSAGIAHELNQPLNAIKIGNDFLKQMIRQGRKITDEDLVQVATNVSAQVDRASEIINRLRTFGRKSDFTTKAVSINTSIKHVMKIIGQQLVLQNIKVTYNLDDDLPPILANENHMEQIIFNLVTNARDAIELKRGDKDETEDRHITLSTFRDSDMVAFTVTDTGLGIPADTQEKIFEPFFTTKEVGKGMGLGLSIIYGIVREYKGNISVDSTEGIGTTFKLTFPIPLPKTGDKR